MAITALFRPKPDLYSPEADRLAKYFLDRANPHEARRLFPFVSQETKEAICEGFVANGDISALLDQRRDVRPQATNDQLTRAAKNVVQMGLGAIRDALYSLDELPDKVARILAEGAISHIKQRPPQTYEDRKLLEGIAGKIVSTNLLSNVQAGVVLVNLYQDDLQCDDRLWELVVAYAKLATQGSRNQLLMRMREDNLALALELACRTTVSENLREYLLEKLLTNDGLAVSAIIKLRPPRERVGVFVRAYLMTEKWPRDIWNAARLASPMVQREYVSALIRIGDSGAVTFARELGIPLSGEEMRELFAQLKANNEIVQRPGGYHWAADLADQTLRQEILAEYQRASAQRGDTYTVTEIAKLRQTPLDDETVDLLIAALKSKAQESEE